MQSKRFGAATKSKACTCGQCKAAVPAGADRWFDNTIFPRKPICHDCYLLAVESPAPDLAALLLFLEQKLPKLITKAVVDALALSELKLSTEQLHALESSTYELPEPENTARAKAYLARVAKERHAEENISDDFV